MKILTVLTYYKPHISGLTIYVERLVRGLVAHGHQITVLASYTNVDKNYPSDTVENGVRVVRAPGSPSRFLGQGIWQTGSAYLSLRSRTAFGCSQLFYQPNSPHRKLHRRLSGRPDRGVH